MLKGTVWMGVNKISKYLLLNDFAHLEILIFLKLQ